MLFPRKKNNNTRSFGHLLMVLFMALSFMTSCSDDSDDPPVTPDPEEPEAIFEDSNLEAQIATALGLNRAITEEDLANLTELNISGSNVTNLAGLEKAVNLEKLEMQSITISSAAPIGSLTKLNYLDMRNTAIPGGDLTFLDGTTGLTYVDFRGTGLSDIGNIAKLTQLREIYLRDNNITDLSALSELTDLIYLNIHTNPVTDISPLANLANLQQLIMRNVQSGDAGLETIKSLTGLWRINARNTGITTLSVFGELMAQGALQNRPDEFIIAEVDIRENEFGEVTETNDPYAPIRPYWENVGERAPEALPEPPVETEFFEDGTLGAIVKGLLGLGDDEPITEEQLLTITELDLTGTDVASIAGVEKMTNLTLLNCNSTQVSDPSPAAALSNLTYLRFSSSNVTDISSLAGLTNLTYFNINRQDQITDISALEGNENMGTLILRNVPFGNGGMTTIATFKNLWRLNMRNTGVTDISLLAQMMEEGALQNPKAPEGETATLDLRQNDIQDYCVIAAYIPQIGDISGYDGSSCE